MFNIFLCTIEYLPDELACNCGRHPLPANEDLRKHPHRSPQLEVNSSQPHIPPTANDITFWSAPQDDQTRAWSETLDIQPAFGFDSVNSTISGV
jgi:hypothetical protein